MDIMSAYAAVKPLYEQASKALTPAHAMKVAAYAVTYRWITDQLGREPTVAEHAYAMDVSESQYHRYRRDFRRAFNVATPLDLPAVMVPSVPTLSAVLKFA